MPDQLIEAELIIDASCSGVSCDTIPCHRCPLNGESEEVVLQRWLVRQLTAKLEEAERILWRMEHPRI